MASSSDQRVEIGKLGQFNIRAGYYVYVGSAFGPGGIRARIAHHLKISERPRWHIDYLRPAMDPIEIWFTFDSRRREHLWAGLLAGHRNATIPVSRFGASDCRCESHLTFFIFRPSGAEFRRQIHAALNRHDKILIKNLLTK